MSTGRRRAILIGCSSFQDKDLDPLRCPEEDVKGMIMTLTEFGKFEVPEPLINPKSTDAESAITKLINDSQADDTVLIYYSGHGIDRPTNLYLATPETVKNTPESNTIRFSTINEAILNRHSRMKVGMILDCCFSGAAGALAGGTGVHILTACRKNESAWERPEDRYSVLTKHIMLGIWDGKADCDGDGRISLHELFEYVRENVKGDSDQTPALWGFDVRDEGFIIAYTKRRSDTARKVLREFLISKKPFLSTKVFDAAHRYIRDRYNPYYEAILKFYRGDMTSGEFLDTWDGLRCDPESRWFEESLGNSFLDMILVPGGTLEIGSSDETGLDREWPQHSVTVQSFYIGRYPITQLQWKAVMSANPSHWQGDNLPVEQVSWDAAQTFCALLSDQTSRTNETSRSYRLPTEAEWEYACRLGKTLDPPNKLDDVAWYDLNSRCRTQPVGKKEPNDLGLYDMLGNVYEWCEDVGNFSYTTTNGEALNNKPENDRELHRVARGGAWNIDSLDCRPTYRLLERPVVKRNNLGLRVVVSQK